MSLAPWSLTPYSAPYVSAEAYWDVMLALETVNAQVGIGDDEYETCDARERVSGSVRASCGVYDTAVARESVTASVLLSAYVAEELHAQEVVSARVAVPVNAYDTASAVERVTARIRIGADVYAAAYAQEAVLASPRVGVDAWEALSVSEFVLCLAVASTTSQQHIAVSVTIPDGATLVLDADTYTATLTLADGTVANVLHLVDDWVSLDREVVGLGLDTGSGSGLTGTLAYRERWL